MRAITAFRNLSLAAKIAVFALITTVTFFGLLALFIAPNILSAITRYGQEQAAGEVKIIQSQFSVIEDEISNAANFLSFAPGLNEALKNSDIQQIRTAVLLQGDALLLDFVQVVDQDGDQLLDLQKTSASLDASMLNSLAQLSFVGGTTTGLIGSEEGSPFLVGVTALKDTTGVVIGAVLAGRRIDSAFMDELRIGRAETHVGFLYNGELAAVTSDDFNQIDRLDEAADLISQAEQGGVAVQVSLGASADDTPDTQAYAPVIVGGSRAGVFALRIEYSVLFELQFQIIQSLRIALLIVVFIASNVLVVLLQFGIIRPFTLLTQQIERITKGEYGERVEIKSKDEIGRLGASFNQMIDIVQQREASLKSLNQTLEQRVADRTRDLREARDEALTAQRLALESSRLKSEFLSTMSHELRTPLNAIEGFSGIMLGGMGIELSPDAEGMMKRISANSKRLLHLINDFLDLTRIESGRLELVKEPIDIRFLVNRWRESVGILAEEKRLDFKIVIDASVPEKIVSDEDALTKIVINLLSNAFKFTRQGRVELQLEADSSRLIVKVTDTGIGIPVHARDYIFEEFRQVDGSSKREYGGTGLGLALVSKLTRLLNGTVSLDSEMGKGSTFSIELPLREEKVLA